jgi:hypothetical protein
MQPTRTRDIHHTPTLSIPHPKIRRRLSDDLKRRSTMQVENRLPLLIRHLVDDTIPRVSRVVDDDVDFAVAEGGGFLDEGCDV